MITVRTALFLLGAATVPSAPAPVHDVDVTSVARVFLDEIGERRYLLSVVDALVPPIGDPATVLPAGCAALPEGESGIRVASGFTFECERALASGDVLTLPWRLAGVVVLANWRDGSGRTAYFRGRNGAVPVSVRELTVGGGSAIGVAATFLRLGTEHILTGFDHLLFVLGLLLLVRGAGPLVGTVTAFTVAHSLTLGASVLGVVPLRRAPIEAAIALSIVLLAREIVVAGRGSENLTHRRPWLVAFAFGLLHGLGFAGALGELGLPPDQIPLALVFFNFGVELGQLVFVSALIALYRLAPRMPLAEGIRLRPLLGYGMGALATLWLFDRLPGLWGG